MKKSLKSLLKGGGAIGATPRIDKYSPILIKSKINGFTLAEVLLTLTIVGIVAAITLPQVIANYRFHTVLNQRKAAASILTDGFTRMMAKEGVTKFEDTELVNQPSLQGRNPTANAPVTSNISRIIKENFSVLKEMEYCGASESVKCDYGRGVDPVIPFVFKNGMVLYYQGKEHGFIDVNGSKGPNYIGYDILRYVLSGSKVYIGNGATCYPSGGSNYKYYNISSWSFPSERYKPNKGLVRISGRYNQPCYYYNEGSNQDNVEEYNSDFFK